MRKLLRSFRRRKWSRRCGCTFVRLSTGDRWQVVWCADHPPVDWTGAR